MKSLMILIPFLFLSCDCFYSTSAVFYDEKEGEPIEGVKISRGAREYYSNEAGYADVSVISGMRCHKAEFTVSKEGYTTVVMPIFGIRDTVRLERE